jgi:hypothetical protein
MPTDASSGLAGVVEGPVAGTRAYRLDTVVTIGALVEARRAPIAVRFCNRSKCRC